MCNNAFNQICNYYIDILSETPNNNEFYFNYIIIELEINGLFNYSIINDGAM